MSSLDGYDGGYTSAWIQFSWKHGCSVCPVMFMINMAIYMYTFSH